MSTLLLRVAGPLQSWGSSSRFQHRLTNREPTKSGIIGLLACALGRRRSEAIADLNDLKIGIRVDQPGTIIKDFHTAKSYKENGEQNQAFVSWRYYLADAVFLVAIEGELSRLEQLKQALEQHAFPIFLGRRSCPPAGKITLGIHSGELLQVISDADWLASEWYQKKQPSQKPLDVVVDTTDADANLERDLPQSFNQEHRQYEFRLVKRFSVTINNPLGK